MAARSHEAVQSRAEIAAIYAPIEEGLARVIGNLKGLAKQQSEFLGVLLDHVFETPGKSVRPALTLLAGQFHPHDGSKTETMATAVELLHIATLIHDDTVDRSDVRRGRKTINSLWGGNTAVLLGDYLFAASATHVCDTGDIRVIRRFAETIMELSSGELQEMAAAYDSSQTVDQYMERIYNKTASLFTTSGESGAVLSGAPEETVSALREYSRNLGMAFQIVDDILDFNGAQEEVGKPVGSDLSRGIVTLPAMLAARRDPDRNPIADLFGNPDDTERLRRSVEMVQDPSVIDEAYSVARDLCDKASQSLDPLPRVPAHASLEALVDYVMSRRM